MALVPDAIVDPKMKDLHLSLVKRFTVKKVGGVQVLLEIERHHVHPVFTAGGL